MPNPADVPGSPPSSGGGSSTAGPPTQALSNANQQAVNGLTQAVGGQMGKVSAKQIKSAGPATIGATNQPGTSNSVALADHVHAHGSQAGGSAHAVATISAAGFLSATDKEKLDGIPSGAAALGNTAPAAVGTAAAAGSAMTGARSDHVHAHGSQTDGAHHAVATVSVAGFMSAADKVKLDGVTAGLAIGSATPATVAAASAVGTASAVSREDHVHAHGAQAGGSLHAVASGAANGFMSAADKTAFDIMQTGAPVYVVRAVCTTNTALTGVSVFIADSVELNAGELVLLTAQTDAKQNGVYAWQAGGTLVRSGLTTSQHFQRSFIVIATVGSVYGSNIFWFQGVAGFVLGTNSIVFSGGSLQLATTSYPGLMAAADKSKLAGIANNATNLQLSGGSPLPAAVGTAAVGVATVAARSDHVHAHGNQAAGSSFHAAADGTNNGFMSAAHYTRLETLKASAVGALGYVTVDALFQTPNTPAYSANLTLDCSVKNDFSVGVLTGNLAITFSNPAVGRSGYVWVKQDATGGRTVSFAATGYTVLRDLASADTNPQQLANSITMYTYQMVTIGGTNCLIITKMFLA